HRLTEFHEDRPKLLECQSQPLTAGSRALTLEPDTRGQQEEQAQGTVEMRRPDEIVESMLQEHALDLHEPRKDAQFHRRSAALIRYGMRGVWRRIGSAAS